MENDITFVMITWHSIASFISFSFFGPIFAFSTYPNPGRCLTYDQPTRHDVNR